MGRRSLCCSSLNHYQHDEARVRVWLWYKAPQADLRVDLAMICIGMIAVIILMVITVGPNSTSELLTSHLYNPSRECQWLPHNWHIHLRAKPAGLNFLAQRSPSFTLVSGCPETPKSSKFAKHLRKGNGTRRVLTEALCQPNGKNTTYPKP